MRRVAEGPLRGQSQIARRTRQLKTWIKRTYRHRFARQDSAEKLIAEAQAFWNDASDAQFKERSHWQGEGLFADPELWNRVGTEYVQLFEQAARWTGLSESLDRVVEWGSGGGLNALRFAGRARVFYGVDVNEPSLHECRRQLEAAGLSNFQPVLIDVEHPRGAVERIDGACDLFLCMNVIESLPSQEYGFEIMRIARDLLRPGGLALVDLQYDNGELDQVSRHWSYARNVANNTSYRINEFWTGCESVGLEPLFARLLPHEPEVGKRRRVAFALRRPVDSAPE